MLTLQMRDHVPDTPHGLGIHIHEIGLQDLPVQNCRLESDEFVPLRFHTYESTLQFVRKPQLGTPVSTKRTSSPQGRFSDAGTIRTSSPHCTFRNR